MNILRIRPLMRVMAAALLILVLPGALSARNWRGAQLPGRTVDIGRFAIGIRFGLGF